MEKDNNFKSKIILLIICAILIIISIGLFITSFRLAKNKYDGVRMYEYSDLVINREDKENKLVKLVITELPYSFATKEKSGKKYEYYLTYDENKYMYIVRLTNNTYEKMKEQYNNDKDNFKYVLKGYIYDIPDQLKDLVINMYNQNSPENSEKLDLSNFNNYFGNTYLDEEITPNSKIYIIIYISGIILSVISVALFIFRNKIY